MVKNEEQVYVKYRYALALRKLLDKNKRQKLRNDKLGIKDKDLDHSYSAISSSTGLRPATLSSILTGTSEIKAYTLFLILNSLGVSFAHFGRVFDALTEAEVIKYKNEIEKEKGQREKRL
ncbi:hypothetical protein [Terrimonas pollutisoli]|uniref:hypothetical protein n=1 Tax=Terrimonas pollutisoli TaxID=3034147 RepID=UPI0023EC9DF8|nr:hypothetical protein [Terrimonas sp. H1YJ31]